MIRRLAMLACLSALWAAPLEAGYEFRSFSPIPTPGEEAPSADPSADGYQPVSGVQQLSPALTDKVVRDLFDAWNTPEMGSRLSGSLANRSRILDAVQTGVPRGVSLHVLGIQNPRVVEQYVRPHPAGDGSYQLLSKLSVRVYCEAAANTAATKRFRRNEGTSEYLIQITQKVWP